MLLLFLAPVRASLAAGPSDELAPGFDACMKKAERTMEVNACLQDAYSYWDESLNRHYRQLMKKRSGSGLAEGRQDLQKAQRAWLAYRDSMAVCLSRTEGGTIDVLRSTEFLARETRRQDRLLARMLNSE